MRNFVQRGDTITATAPVGGVASGDGVLIEDLFGVAAIDGAEGEEFEMTTAGVFTLPKAAGAIGWGAKVYWDSAAANVTTTDTDNTLIGAAVQDVGSGAGTILVRLNGAVV